MQRDKRELTRVEARAEALATEGGQFLGDSGPERVALAQLGAEQRYITWYLTQPGQSRATA